MKKNEIYLQELERIRLKNGGVLKPQDVVDEAKNPQNPLHKCFCWDDEVAAYNYRIVQARQLIRICITKVEALEEPVRVYVSLEPDRVDGGYRTLTDVMTNEDFKNQLLLQAKRDMRTFEQKYFRLDELAEVFTAMRQLR